MSIFICDICQKNYSTRGHLDRHRITLHNCDPLPKLDRGSKKGWKHTEQTLEKMRGRTFSEDHRKALSVALKGKPHSEARRRKHSESKKGSNKGPNNPFFGKTHSLEIRKRISEARTGKSLSPEHREKISNGVKRAVDKGFVPVRNGGPKQHKKGIFKCKNPSKYLGNCLNIIYRSSWELRFMIELDNNPNVLKWSSEERSIIYYDKARQRNRRYFPDFILTYIHLDGTIKTKMVEIKPSRFVNPPKVRKRNTEKYLEEVTTYITNQCKWDAAKLYCEKKGWEFVVMTEFELGIKPSPNEA